MNAILTNPFSYVWAILILSALRALMETYLRRSAPKPTAPASNRHTPITPTPLVHELELYDWAQDPDA